MEMVIDKLNLYVIDRYPGCAPYILTNGSEAEDKTGASIN